MAQQVTARIVIAQAGNAPPGGYVDGGRDDLVVGSLITLTNADNAGALGHKWVLSPCAALAVGDYGVSGAESPTCTLTPPSPDGYGDCFIELTVFGAPLPNGAPNVAIDRVPLGIRAQVSGYAAGVPIPSYKETSAGGRGTLSAFGGREFRFQEGFYAIVKQVISSGIADATTLRSRNGGGTPTSYVAGGVTLRSGSDKLKYTLDVGTKTFTLTLEGTVVDSIEDEAGNVAFGALKLMDTASVTWVVDDATGEIRATAAGGGGGAGVNKLLVDTDEFTGDVAFYGVDGVYVALDDASSIKFGLDPLTTIRSIQKQGNVPIFGAVELVPQDGIVMTQSGQEIRFSASQFRANAGAYVSGDLSFVDTSSVTVSRSSGNFSFTGMRLRSGVNAYLAGDVSIAAGNGVTVGQASQTITVTASRWRANTGTYTSGDLSITGAGGTSVSESAGVFTVTGYALPTNFTIADVSNVMTLQRSDASAARTFRLELYSSNAQGNNALGSLFDFAFTNQSTGVPTIPFAITPSGVEAYGTVQQRQAGTSKSDTLVQNVNIDTSTTTATTIGSLQPGTNKVVTVTVCLQHDNATLGTTGRTVYTHTYRRGPSGAPVAQGSGEDLSVAAKKLGHAVTFTLATNQINVNVVAATSNATKHRGSISWEIGDIS